MYYIKTLENYCVICKKNTAKTNSSVWKTKQNRSMLVSSSVCGKKKSRFIKNQEMSGLLGGNSWSKLHYLIFQMISLKGIKSLRNFCWLGTNLCPNYIYDNHDLLTALVRSFLNIVKGFKHSNR